MADADLAFAGEVDVRRFEAERGQAVADRVEIQIDLAAARRAWSELGFLVSGDVFGRSAADFRHVAQADHRSRDVRVGIKTNRHPADSFRGKEQEQEPRQKKVNWRTPNHEILRFTFLEPPEVGGELQGLVGRLDDLAVEFEISLGLDEIDKFLHGFDVGGFEKALP